MPEPEVDEPEAPQPETTRDVMQRVFEESLTDSDPGDETDLVTEAPSAEDGRARDEKGRFAKKVSEPETALEAGTQPIPGVTEEQAGLQPAAPITAPRSVPGELRQAWTQLPREWQEWTAKREQETQDSLRTQGRQVTELNEVLKEHVADWEVRGITPAQVLKQHLAWSKQFESNPLSAMFRLGELYGVTPQHVAQHLQMQSHAQQHGQPQQQQYGNAPLPPQLQLALERIESFETQQQQAMVAHQQAFAESHYDTFANATDASGNLLHPFFWDAMPIMRSMAAGLKEQFKEEDPQTFLGIAYRAACNAHPELAKKLAESDEKARQQRERQQVEQARRMGSSVRGAPNGAAGAPKRFNSTREAMQAAYEGKL